MADLYPALRAYRACECDVRLQADLKRCLAITESEAALGVAITPGRSGRHESKKDEESELDHFECGA